MSSAEEEIKRWERIGPEAVRLQLQNGVLTGSAAHRASAWLGPKDEEAQRQTLKLSEAATRHANRANMISLASLAVAVAALAVAFFRGGG